MSTSLFDAIRNADVSMVTSLVKENPTLAQEKDQRGSTETLLDRQQDPLLWNNLLLLDMIFLQVYTYST